MQKNSNSSGRPDRYLYSLRVLKQTIELSVEQKRKVYTKERLLKLIKKNMKVLRHEMYDLKLTTREVDRLYQSCFTSIKELITQAENSYKDGRSDFQAVLLKRKHHGDPELKGMPMLLPLLSVGYLTSYELSEKCLVDPNFEIQLLEVSKLCGLVSHRLHELLLKVIGERCCSKSTLSDVVGAMSRHYNVVPYHNFTHAAGVFLMFCYCYSQKEASAFIDPLEMLFEGLNNLYQSKAKTEVALDYSYSGTLERMHLWKMNQFMEGYGKAVLEGLSKYDITRGKRVITRAILSTDMAKHYNYVDEMKYRNNRPSKGKTAIDTKLDSDREYLVEVVTHACDIGNPCLSYSNYIHWANFVCLEFNDQTVKEHAIGIDTTSFLKFTTMGNFYRNQSSFTSTVVLPLWTYLSVALPELRHLRDQITINMKQIDEAQKEQPKKR